MSYAFGTAFDGQTHHCTAHFSQYYGFVEQNNPHDVLPLDSDALLERVESASPIPEGRFAAIQLADGGDELLSALRAPNVTATGVDESVVVGVAAERGLAHWD